MTKSTIFTLVLLVIVCLWLLPKWQARAARKKLTATELPMAENEFRKTLAQIIGGMVVLLGLGFTWDEVQNGKAQLALAVSKLEDERKARAFEQQIAQSRLITDRFTRAVDQLGSQDIAVRLGGIYALERIAKDGDKDYHWSVIEVIVGFLRQKVPYRWESVGAGGELEKKAEERLLDVEAAIAVIARRDASLEREALNLNYLNLEGAMLRNARLEKVLLMNTSLKGAWLERADLQGADLTFAQMDHAGAAGANLQGATLTGSHLSAADFSGADLSHAIFYESKLDYAYLIKARLNGAELVHARLDGANLAGADLQGADLEHASLKEANLEGANLAGARLDGADLSGARVTQEQIDKACGQSPTLPGNLKMKQLCPFKPLQPYREKGIAPPPS